MYRMRLFIMLCLLCVFVTQTNLTVHSAPKSTDGSLEVVLDTPHQVISASGNRTARFSGTITNHSSSPITISGESLSAPGGVTFSSLLTSWPTLTFNPGQSISGDLFAVTLPANLSHAEGVYAIFTEDDQLISVPYSVDISSGKTVYVSKSGNDSNDGLSWATAKLTVGNAIGSAAEGDQVWVAAGTYTEHLWIPKNLSLLGGFVGTEASPEARTDGNRTILDGGGNAVVIAMGDQATNILLDGLTIQHGHLGVGAWYSNGDFIMKNCQVIDNNNPGWVGGLQIQGPTNVLIEDSLISNNTGDGLGGMFIGPANTVTISDCDFVSNTATTTNQWGRGGLAVENAGQCTVSDSRFENNQASELGAFGIFACPDVLVTRSQFVNNRGMGNFPNWSMGVCNIWSNLANSQITVSDCEFTGNSANAEAGLGVGAFTSATSIHFTRNLVANNEGNGMLVFGGGVTNVTNSTFADNKAHPLPNQGASGAFDMSGNGLIANCLFARNEADFNGADRGSRTVSVWAGDALVVNNTFVANKGRGFVAGGGNTVTLHNNIIASNTMWGVESWGGTINDNYNCYFGNVWGPSSGITRGANDVLINPDFVNAAGGDYHLNASSLCVDHGNNASVSGTLDRDGFARIQGNAVDIGCFESSYSWVNRPPVAVNDFGFSEAGTPLRLNVLSNDSDPDLDLITLTGVAAPANGTAVINTQLGPAQIIYTPNAGFVGTDTFQYTIQDPSGLSATATVTILVSVSQNTNKLRQLWLQGFEGLYDDVGFDILVDSSGASYFTGYYQPSTTDYNMFVFGISAAGVTLFGNGNSSSPTGLELAVSIARNAAGELYLGGLAARDAGAAWVVKRTNNPFFLNYYANGTDVALDAINKVALDTSGNVYSAGWVRNTGNGSDGLLVKFDANLNLIWQRELHLSVSDFYMHLAVMPDGGAVAVGATRVAADNGFLLARYDANGNLVMQDVFDTSGHNHGNSVAVAPNGDFSALSVSASNATVRHYQASNLTGAVWSVTVPGTWRFNDQDYGGDLAMDAAGNTYVATYSAGDISLVKLDPTGAVVWSRLYDGAAHGDDYPTRIKVDANGILYVTGSETVAGQGYDMVALSYDSDGNLRWRRTVNGSANGADNGLFIATNSLGVVSVSGFRNNYGNGRDVLAVSYMEAPLARADSHTTAEDTPIVNAATVLTNDIFVQTGVVEAVASTQNGTLTLRPDGTFDYTPNPNYHGTDTFTYRVVNGTLVSDTVTVSITVNPVNDAPVAVNDTASTAKNTPALLSVLANDSDVEGDPLTISSVTQPANGSVIINANQSLTYTPLGGFTGTDTFTYTISDGNGGTATATVTITVTAGAPSNNNPPSAKNDNAATPFGAAVRILVLANDTDADGDILTVVNVTQPANGLVLINPDNTVTYTPANGFSGTNTFTYTISDGRGGVDTATVTVNVAANRPPDAVNDRVDTLDIASITIPVLANDTDPEGQTLMVTGITQPSVGSVLLNSDGTVTYTPSPGYKGSDTFTYTISDGYGGTDTASVIVSVTANRPPRAMADSVTTPRNTPVTINVLANDSDPDGDLLTVTGITQPASGGTAVLNQDGTIMFTPATGFKGKAKFTYTISDGKGGTDIGNVTVTVQ